MPQLCKCSALVTAFNLKKCFCRIRTGGHQERAAHGDEQSERDERRHQQRELARGGRLVRRGRAARNDADDQAVGHEDPHGVHASATSPHILEESAVGLL